MATSANQLQLLSSPQLKKAQSSSPCHLTTPNRFNTKFQSRTCRKPLNVVASSSTAGGTLPQVEEIKNVKLTVGQRPDKFGKFGKYGGKYVPEIMVQGLSDLESAFRSLANDQQFQEELSTLLRDFAGRETPLYFAEHLSGHYRRRPNGEGPQIYLKREDLCHTGSHKINSAIAQALLAKRLGKKCLVTETSAGHHGVAVAAACAKLGLRCVVFMGAGDFERQASHVARMRVLGAEVLPVRGGAGELKDAAGDALRYFSSNMELAFLVSSAVGPHPGPEMVRDFQAVIGRETRRQAVEKWGGKPDVLVACVGMGSNAMGLFHEFVDDDEVRMIGVEAAGAGLGGDRHSATLAKGDVGVWFGALSYLLQDGEGNISHKCHSVAPGFRFPGVGPEHSYLKDIGRVEYKSVTDEEALKAFDRLCKLEGIIPALETAHALAHLEVLCPTLPDRAKVVVNCSGTGDTEATLEAYARMQAILMSQNLN